MKRRGFLTGMAALLAASAVHAQTAAPAPVDPAAAPAPAPAAVEAPAPHPMGKIIKVKLTTGEGDIVVELYPDKAPITVANWLRYVDGKRYDNSTFYRASHPPGVLDFGVIQGGLENNPEKVFKPIAHEPTTMTGVKHVDGAISMGRNAPGSATSDYFIVVGNSAYLDADPSKPGDNLGYPAFGKVIEGMDVVRKIIALPTSPTLGTGAMKGQMLMPRVKVLTARRVP